MVMVTCSALGVFYVVEQPLSSMLQFYPAINAALRATGARSISLLLYKFGATTQKPLKLWGTAPWLPCLGEIAKGINAPQPTATLATTAMGRVTGKKGALVESASYPHAFCQIVAYLQKEFLFKAASFKRPLCLEYRMGEAEQDAKRGKVDNA